MKEWHFMLGLLIFALVFVRLALRWMSPTPRIVPELSRSCTSWQNWPTSPSTVF